MLERWRIRFSRARVGAVVVYHRIGDPPGDQSRELVPAFSTAVFEAQLRLLRSHYRVVPPSAFLEQTRRRRFGRRVPVAVTFDDDLRTHVETALPVLTRVGVPAGFFLCGASLDTPQRFWWQDLQLAADERRQELRELAAPYGDVEPVLAGAPGALRLLARSVEAAAPAARASFAVGLRKLAGAAEADALDADSIRALAAAGFEIGFHTLRHEPLPTLGDDRLEHALVEGRSRLEEVVGRPLRALAYPHGRATAREADAARAAGYSWGFTGRPEAVRGDTDPLLLGRIEPSFESAEALEAQLGRAIAAAARG